METRVVCGELPGVLALETSLVEWKQPQAQQQGRTATDLGNFLSGMETGSHPADQGCRRGALETSLVEWKRFLSLLRRVKRATLETSLVEWKQRSLLDNILGDTALETSLVEWKLTRVSRSSKLNTCLGNFLSGMETQLHVP